MRILLLLPFLIALASCSQFSATRYADAAQDVAVARANGLGSKHPNRVALEETMGERASGNPAENRAAIAARIVELEAKLERLKASGFTEGQENVDSLAGTIEELEALNP